MRVYKRTRKDKKTGQIIQANKYTVEWHDSFNDLRTNWPAYSDKASSLEFGRSLELLSQQRSVGTPLSGELSAGVDSLSASVVAKLVKINLIEASRASSCEPLAQHVDEYAKWRIQQGKHEKDTRTVIDRINRVCQVAGFNSWADVQLGGSSALEAAIGKIQDADGLTDRTRNRFGMAFNAFGNWMVKRKKASHNPVRGWQRLREFDRDYRRALDPEEARRLIIAAEAGGIVVGRTNKGRWHFEKYGKEMPGGVRWSLTGEDRAMLYLTALHTTLRRGELERLAVSHFTLTGPEPTVRVVGKRGAKNRETRLIPLKSATAKRLREYFVDKVPAAPAFRLPPIYDTADMLRNDLAVARRTWIDEGATAEERARRHQSDFLAPVDAEGRKVDFHCLRTTGATWLDVGGVAPSIAKNVTGHRAESTLQRHYQHASRADTRRAVDVLPDIDPTSAAATGTDDQADLPPENLTAFLTAPGRNSAHLSDARRDQIRDNETETRIQALAVGLEPTTCGLEDRCSIQLSYASYPLFYGDY